MRRHMFNIPVVLFLWGTILWDPSVAFAWRQHSCPESALSRFHSDASNVEEKHIHHNTKDTNLVLRLALAIPPGGEEQSQQAEKENATVSKQGAYGKVPIHKEPIWQQLLHLDELVYVVLFLIWKQTKSKASRFAPVSASSQKIYRNNNSNSYIQERFHGKLDDLAFCNEMLGKVSRSFSTVIRQLPERLMVDVLIFYLILRALDTIEDDVQTFSSSPVKKREQITLLKKFHEHALAVLSSSPSPSSSANDQATAATTTMTCQWKLDNVGEGDERRLLEEFPRVQRIYSALSEESRTIIADITKRMGAGMAETVGKDMSQGTKDVVEYNKYCHYVAGLVGEGLSRLFAQSGLEESYFANELYLSDQMGLFLQKTNIIRDYLEDFVEGRTFWPQSIWKKYANGTDDLGYFNTFTNNETDAVTAKEIQANALKCLNEMITDALEQVPACLAYLSELHCLEVFRFCAIPQVMAMATLAKCYANPNVFSGVVKIRKGLSCKLMLKASNNLDGVHQVLYEMAKSIETKAHKLRRSGFLDPSIDPLLDACDVICAITESAYKRQQRAKLVPVVFVACVLACQWTPYLTQLMVAVAILNYFIGPFQFWTEPNTNPAFLVIPRLWKEVMGKKK